MASKRRVRFVTGLLALAAFVACNSPSGSNPAKPPSPSSTPPNPTPPSGLPYSRGVNLAGADFGENVLPGVFGTNYIYPNQTEVEYLSATGMNIFRLPFRWKRLQRTLNADLNAEEAAQLDGFVNATTARGKLVILDPHNYARYNGQLVGSSEAPNAAFADFWRRLALRYKGNPNVAFGLVNEPHDIPTAQWVSAANAEAMLGIVDSGDNLGFEVHQYIDSDGSGTHDACVSPTIGSEHLKTFTLWSRDHNRTGLLGELSSGKNAQCDTALEDMVRCVESNADVWRGWTYWAAGPWWPDGASLEPKNNQDARQLPILQ